MADVLRTVSTRRTPQSQRADARQVKNSAGGYTFVLDDTARLRRFLTLGTEGGTYYTSAQDLTQDAADVVIRLAQHDPVAAVGEIVSISTSGRAPKANPALFALAVLASVSDDAGRRAALDALPLVARTGTHLFLFARYVEQFRGWGRGLRRAVARWYEEKSDRDLAYQAAKYRQREGWSHRDLLRLAHPAAPSLGHSGVYDWICGRDRDPIAVPPLLDALDRLGPGGYSGLVREAVLAGASWEMLPDSVLADPATWTALLEQPGGMPQTALIRQLPRLTRLGVLTPAVIKQISDPDRLRKARVHPINVLVAQRTYASGRSARGEGEWTPDRRVVDALDAAFYASFGAVEPTGKRIMLALDVSGSMTSPISGMPISAREASAALALVTASVEDDYTIVGFTGSYGWIGGGATTLTPLAISPRQRLDDAIRTVSNLSFGATDCALPMLHALKKGLKVDTFIVYTDNETWAGSMHPHQALREYRDRAGIPARLVVVGMTSTGFSIADPRDPGMLDVAGFDSAVPGLVSDFARGL